MSALDHFVASWHRDTHREVEALLAVNADAVWWGLPW
jgi:hypothetical protein